MGVKRHDSDSANGAGWLDLLHRDLDGDLTPAEQEALRALPNQTEIQRARLLLGSVQEELARVTALPLPASIAGQVAQEVAWSAHLKAAAPPPTVPPNAALAGELSRQIALNRDLQAAAVPTLPRSIAASVVSEIRAARQFQPPRLPRSGAAGAAHEIAWAARTRKPIPPQPHSVAAAVVARIQNPQPEEASAVEALSLPGNLNISSLIPQAAPGSLGVAALADPLVSRRNPAPMLLALLLMLSLTLLAVTSAWPNLAAGALVLRTLLAQVSPLAGVGLALLLLTSALITWRPTPAMRRVGAGAFALSAFITLPALTTLASSGDIRFGQNIAVNSVVNGNVIAVGGNIHLQDGARVNGEVVTLLGDVQRDNGARVTGRVNALLGRAPGDVGALQIAPPDGIGLLSAAAFRPVLGWLGSAAWPQIFVTLTGGALLLLFVAGAAPMLVRRQRHAPMRTLALGILALAALIGPALGLGVAGLLGPALVAAAVAVVLVAVGLSVSAYDAGRSLALRAKLPVPDAVGAMLGLSAVAASLSEPPLAVTLALIGGAWGAGTLLLTRQNPVARVA